MLDGLIFRHFWTTLSITGGLAQWLVWVWLLDGVGIRPAPVLWVAGPLGLALLFRLGTRVLQIESEIRTGPERLGAIVVATGFVGLVGCGVVGLSAVLWIGIGWLADVSAHAGVLNVSAAAVTFRPFGLLALAGSTIALTYGYVHGYRRLRVQELTVAIPDLPIEFDGYRIAHLSDVHLGPIADRAALRVAFRELAKLAPDLVCVTGDIVDTPNADLAAWMPELRAVQAPDGVLAILGNHDLYSGRAHVIDAIARWTDWHLLADEVATIERGGARVHVAGLEHGLMPAAAERLHRLWRQVPTGDAGVLLVHHPNMFDTAVAAGVPLTLAGHTHGGQLAVPGFPRLNAARLVGFRYDRGLHALGRSLLHVSCGLGTSGQRVRVGVPRDLTILRLVPDRAHPNNVADRVDTPPSRC